MNMLAFHSFGTAVAAALGPAQFLALYLTGGVVSSLGSTALSIARRRTVPSLGASGAILTLAATFAFLHPDASFSLIFLPWVAIPAKAAVAGIVALDLFGLVRGWQFFDHTAHLGGMAVGLWYVEGGGFRHVRAFQQQVCGAWYDLRR
jgi:rhomboid-like protein